MERELKRYIEELKVRNDKAQRTINDFAFDESEAVQATRLRMIIKYNLTVKTIKELEELL